MAATHPTSGPGDLGEQVQALHEEIGRLPEKYRSVLILCDLQRISQGQAAGELRLTERTLQRRLGQARQRLKARLTRRGLAPTGAILGTILLREAQAAVPSAWGEATVRAALAASGRGIASGIASAAAQEFTHEVLKMMLIQKLAYTTAILLSAGLIAWGASATLISSGDEPPRTVVEKPAVPPRNKSEGTAPRAKPAATEPTPEVPEKVRFAGRVIGPDDKPVADAKIFRTPATGNLRQPYEAPQCATTGPDGRFAFVADRTIEFVLRDLKGRMSETVVAAVAPGFGIAWVDVPKTGKTDDLTLRLVADQPVTGQVVDLEGRPIVGATLQTLEIRGAVGEDLRAWLETPKGKEVLRQTIDRQFFPRLTIAMPEKVTTDAEGRFRLAGFGRDRFVLAQLDGPGIASEYFDILTRPGEPFKVQEVTSGPRFVTVCYGSDFRHAAAPTKPVVGVVRDKDTKAPLPGVVIRSESIATRPMFGTEFLETTTDAQGRYRLSGMPKGQGNSIRIYPARDQPYLIGLETVPDSRGLDPVTLDVELKRGLWIEGRLTDKDSGTPLRSVISYFAQPGNPNINEYMLKGSVSSNVQTNDDGTYRLAGMPGPGFLTAGSIANYLRSTERDDELGVKEVFFPTVFLPLMNYGAFARIDPSLDAGPFTQNLTLNPGWSFQGTVLGPDGKPLAGAWGIGLDSWNGPWKARETLKTAEFTVRRFNPRRPRDILFQHPTTRLVGASTLPKAKGDAITARLQPGATITGRLVDEEGRPRAGFALRLSVRPKAGPDWLLRYFPPEQIKTDRDGKFRVESLLPGYEFRLSNDTDGIDELSFDGPPSGQTKDLGEVRLGPPQ